MRKVSCPKCKETKNIRIVKDKDKPFTGTGLFSCGKCNFSWK